MRKLIKKIRQIHHHIQMETKWYWRLREFYVKFYIFLEIWGPLIIMILFSLLTIMLIELP